MEEIKDRRIRKTKTAVHDALLSLMRTKPIAKISVQELTTLADINRKTFYNHYCDLYAVLDEVENACVDHLFSLFPVEEMPHYIQNPKTFFSRFIREMRDNKDIYMLMMQSEGYSNIAQKLINKEKELLRTLMHEEHMDETLVDYFLFFISAGITSVIKNWFISDQEVSEEALSGFFSYLFSNLELKKLETLIQFSAGSKELS